MKSATAGTLSTLASGQYLLVECYEITPVGGSTLRFTALDIPVTVGGNTYVTGLTVTRSSVKQVVGLNAQTLSLTLASQIDNPAGEVTIGGYTISRACREGVLDRAKVVMRKGFFPRITTSAPQLDTSNGLVSWFSGNVNDVRPRRSRAEITVISYLEQLNVRMPRNVIQTGCVHTLFDSGCGLVKASFTQTSAVAASPAPTVLTFKTTGLTAPDGYFDLGVITFTSGANSGISRTVKAYLNSGGQVTVIAPFPNAPAAGDGFSIVPGCDKAQATCSGKFSNLGRFRGFPYVPIPETMYGGAANSDVPAPGGQGGAAVGSAPSGGLNVPYGG